LLDQEIGAAPHDGGGRGLQTQAPTRRARAES
jgi:hypothetical protein